MNAARPPADWPLMTNFYTVLKLCFYTRFLSTPDVTL